MAVREGCRASSVVAYGRAAGVNSPSRVPAVWIRTVLIALESIVLMISLKLSLRWIFRRRENGLLAVVYEAVVVGQPRLSLGAIPDVCGKVSGVRPTEVVVRVLTR